ncbi:MAG: hypothetical protein A3G41_07660 [Elusimicrobia bacterium RIFCSPLOWO2_12_FULL_59_9]|nr:MAG: hypothetical protein A3G41_07660 [Elusimicrobia bacterium RIFCSPLOWO2_12_FULL_59_9]
MDYFLARLPIFKKLPSAELSDLPRQFLLRRYRRQEPIFQEGDPPAAVFLLRSGLVKAVKYSPRVAPFAMEVIVPGKLFGMIAALDGRPYPVSAVPIKECEAYRIPARAFENLMKGHSDFSREVYAEVGSHLRQSQSMRSLSKEPVEKRIAFILCLLARSMGNDLPVRREDIAELSGCTQETAIRTLVDFRNKKLLSSGWKKIVVLKPDRLKALSGMK